ncbi:MAG TPA: HAMP domain-containing sensor histidine kinase, partial [Luteitalea sp.]|nr:HAMP domain-containing sensor histidine kinase [Luteitalea sp.]
TADELVILQTLAESSSLALENVQLWGEMERTNARERAARVQAEELSALKDHFLATVSHELRTPLNVIQGWVWQLRQRDVAPEIMARAVDALDRNTQLQARLVEDLLDTSRAVAGTLDIDDRPVDLTSVCRIVVDTVAPSALDKGVSVTFEATAGEAVSIRGDAQRMQQILWNLLSNAIKFTPAGGTVAVSVTRTETNALVVVKDTGLGISPEFLPFAFDRFRQADSTSTRIHNGLGVGLAIVQELVRLHGGEVRATSDGKDKGTTITVELPLPLELGGEMTGEPVTDE